MAEIKNTFLKGKMNQDLDSRILPNGEYREARNLSISRSESSTVGEFENVLGNTAISSLSDLTPPAIAGTEIIGQLIDENKQENTIAHELFHHWFGDLVTSESWSNLTLNESFAIFESLLKILISVTGMTFSSSFFLTSKSKIQ